MSLSLGLCDFSFLGSESAFKVRKPHSEIVSSSGCPVQRHTVSLSWLPVLILTTWLRCCLVSLLYSYGFSLSVCKKALKTLYIVCSSSYFAQLGFFGGFLIWTNKNIFPDNKISCQIYATNFLIFKKMPFFPSVSGQELCV